VALLFVAAVWTLGLVGMSIAQGLVGWDVRFAYLPAAELVLDGKSPYPALDDPILLDQKGYVYPPQLLFAVLPLTPLPDAVAGTLVAAILIALVVATLRVLGVTDLRCYAAAFLWMPTMSGLLLANVSIPLAFAAAVVWKYRDEVWQPAVALGLTISAKLLFWPLFVWTLATRRLRATAWAVTIGLGVTLAAGPRSASTGLRATRTCCGGSRRSSRRTATPSSGLPTHWGFRSGRAAPRCCWPEGHSSRAASSSLVAATTSARSRRRSARRSPSARSCGCTTSSSC
jgi:hypothetical protein